MLALNFSCCGILLNVGLEFLVLWHFLSFGFMGLLHEVTPDPSVLLSLLEFQKTEGQKGLQ